MDINDGVVYQNNYIAFKNGMIFNLHGDEIKGYTNRGGYPQSVFNGRTREFHKVISDCFIENSENLRDVNHKNGNKLDSSIDNLERLTHSENVIHAYEHGLIKPQYGEEHHNAKLTENDIRYIRSSDKSSYQIARELNVDSSTVRDIRRGKTWRHVK